MRRREKGSAGVFMCAPNVSARQKTSREYHLREKERNPEDKTMCEFVQSWGGGAVHKRTKDQSQRKKDKGRKRCHPGPNKRKGEKIACASTTFLMKGDFMRQGNMSPGIVLQAACSLNKEGRLGSSRSVRKKETDLHCGK